MKETITQVFYIIKLKIIGSKLLISTLDLIQTKDFKTKNQDFSKDYLLAPKLTKSNTRINWNANSETIHNKIRGLSPYPVAWSKIKKNDKILKIYKSKLTSKKPSETTIPGKIIFDKNFIYVTTNNYLIEILELQIQGKRVMNNIEFSNGYKILKSSITLKKGNILYADPTLNNDLNFSRSVVILVEENNVGYVGFIINKKSIYSTLDLIPEIKENFEIFDGGPVEKENLYFIHNVPDLIKKIQLKLKKIYTGAVILTK